MHSPKDHHLEKETISKLPVRQGSGLKQDNDKHYPDGGLRNGKTEPCHDLDHRSNQFQRQTLRKFEAVCIFLLLHSTGLITDISSCLIFLTNVHFYTTFFFTLILLFSVEFLPFLYRVFYLTGDIPITLQATSHLFFSKTRTLCDYSLYVKMPFFLDLILVLTASGKESGLDLR